VVPHPVRPVDQVDAADEEGEVRVRLPRDGAPIAPEPRAARAVEGDDDELRRPPGPLGREEPRPSVGRPRRRRLLDRVPVRRVRAEAAEPDDGEAARRKEAEPETHDRIVGGAASASVEPE
jgi:hypothetical protein